MRKIEFETFDGVRLKGVEFRPRQRSVSGFPALLLIEGSGKSPTGTPGKEFPFFQLGRELAKDGYYVLTYNKRGSGLNSKNGSFYRSSFWTDNKDAQAALDFLKSRRYVNKKQVFLLGQSMGGVHITFLAKDNDIAGNIYFASVFKDFRKLLLQQTAEILGLLGKPPKVVKLELKTLVRVLNALDSGKFRCEDYPDICQNIDGANIIDGVQERYFKEILKIDSARHLADLDIPLLIMQGTSDFIVNLDDFSAARKALRRAGRKNACLTVLPKVDHVFSEQPTKAASLKYMRRVQVTKRYKVSKKVLREIRRFLGSIASSIPDPY